MLTQYDYHKHDYYDYDEQTHRAYSCLWPQAPSDVHSVLTFKRPTPTRPPLICMMQNVYGERVTNECGIALCGKQKGIVFE